METRRLSLLALISGICIGFSYIPFYAILGLFSLVPLFLALDEAKNLKQVFKYSWISQFILSLIGFHWVATTAHDFGYMPWWLSIIVLLVFCSVMHIHFCIAFMIWFKLKNKFQLKQMQSDILKVLCLFALETYWPMLFPWNFGYTWMTSAFPIAQTAEIWGFTGLSFLSILANAYIKQIYHARQNNNAAYAQKIIIGVLASIFCLSLLGYSLKESVPSYDKKWKIGVVQANIGNFDKVQAEHGYDFQRAIVDKYLDLTKQLLEKESNLDLVIWPETAIPVSYTESSKNSQLFQKIQLLINQSKTPLLAGSFLKEHSLYNGAGLWLPKIGLSTKYLKTMLLAFGETVPFTENFPEVQRFIKKTVPAISFFGKGSGSVPMDFQQTKIGVNICYEGIHPNFVIDLKNKGSQIFINLTNDSWFGKTFEPYQHLYMTLARSIEHRIPSIRSTNTGISTAISAHGEIMERSPLHQEWTGAYELEGHINPPKTLYQIIGKYILAFAILISLGLMFLFREKSNQ